MNLVRRSEAQRSPAIVAFRGFIITIYLKALTPFAQCLTLGGVAPGVPIEGHYPTQL
jgi:hypothetical protein